MSRSSVGSRWPRLPPCDSFATGRDRESKAMCVPQVLLEYFELEQFLGNRMANVKAFGHLHLRRFRHAAFLETQNRRLKCSSNALVPRIVPLARWDTEAISKLKIRCFCGCWLMSAVGKERKVCF